MRKINGSFEHTDVNGNLVTESIFSYDEDEMNRNTENAQNASLIWMPEFIPFPIKEWQENNLTYLEALLYGFIKFFLTNNKQFYWNNEQLAKLFKCHPDTISGALNKLQKSNLVLATYSQGRNRKIQLNRGFVNPRQKHRGVSVKIPRGVGKNTGHIENNYREYNIEKEKEEKKARSLSKKSFGEDSVVFLSEEEWGTLCRRHGYYVVRRFVDQLNNYIKQVGKDKYASHYHTILNWIAKSRARGELKPSGDDFRADDFATTAEYEAILNKFNT